MKNIKRITLGILTIFTCGMLCMAPAFAADNDHDGYDDSSSGNNCVPTSILGSGGQMCDDGSGSSIKEILLLVVDIISIGIGIVGVIGIVWAGTLYLTAGGDPSKVQKAKKRIFEIVLGLAIYVVIYALLRWLLPGFSL